MPISGGRRRILSAATHMATGDSDADTTCAKTNVDAGVGTAVGSCMKRRCMHGVIPCFQTCGLARLGRLNCCGASSTRAPRRARGSNV
jgi:hypothetical protein